MKTWAIMAWRCTVVASLVLLTSCDGMQHGFLAAAGPVAAAEREHFFSIIGWTMIVIVPLFIATPIVLWKYRLGRKGVYRPEWTFSWILEGLIWGLPLVIVAILGWSLWDLSHKLDPYDPIASDKPALNIKVVSLDWKWLFIYPDQGIATANVLELPVDRPISFTLTSATVMQSFFIPRLGSQIYTMPGMITHLHLLAATPGQYLGMNTQYNGEGFAEQKFAVHAVSEADFKRWVAQQRTRPALDANTYKQLAQRSVLPEPKRFGSVPSHLFQQIVARTQSIPASQTSGAAPTSEQEQEQETQRVKKQRRAYQHKREHGA